MKKITLIIKLKNTLIKEYAWGYISSRSPQKTFDFVEKGTLKELKNSAYFSKVTKVYLIIPTKIISNLKLDLPLELQNKKNIQTTVEFLAEEYIFQKIEDVKISIIKRGANYVYVSVVDKKIIDEITLSFLEIGIDIDLITSEAMCLPIKKNHWTVLSRDSSKIIKMQDFDCIELKNSLFNVFLNEHQPKLHNIYFQNSKEEFDFISNNLVNNSTNLINLNSEKSPYFRYRTKTKSICVLTFFFIISFFLSKISNNIALQSKVDVINEEIKHMAQKDLGNINDSMSIDEIKLGYEAKLIEQAKPKQDFYSRLVELDRILSGLKDLQIKRLDYNNDTETFSLHIEGKNNRNVAVLLKKLKNLKILSNTKKNNLDIISFKVLG